MEKEIERGREREGVRVGEEKDAGRVRARRNRGDGEGQ